MGDGGIIAFKQPFSNYQIPNYPIILNLLPELRKTIERLPISNSLVGDYAIALQEALLRHMGALEDSLQTSRNYLKNPLVWFREGVGAILFSPFSLLAWMGVIGQSTISWIKNTLIFRRVSGIITFIGAFSAIMSIVLGWEEFLTVIKGFFKK